MSSEIPPAFPSPLTPCVGICRLDAQGYCVGCRRSGAEIARWIELDDAERLRLMREVLPQRRAGEADHA